MKKYLFIFVALISMMMVSCSQDSQLEIAVAAANRDCPDDWGDGLVMKSIKIEGINVVYTVTCDENLYDMDMMNENRESMKEIMLESFHTATGSEADDIQALYDMLKGTDKGILFKYVGDTSGKEVDIHLSHSDLI